MKEKMTLKRIRFRKDGKIDIETDKGTAAGCTLHINTKEGYE